MADRYWISGSQSNWNNTANWAASSGGGGGETVPGASDNVYFDDQGLGRCVLDIPVSIASLDMQDGDIDFNKKDFSTSGNFRVRAGATFVPTGLNETYITVGGNLNIAGEAGAYLDWVATAPWDITVSGTATGVYVNVMNSNASRGSTINATNSGDAGFNTNWSITTPISLEERYTEYHTLTATDISNKYVQLDRTPYAPSEVAMNIVKGSTQQYGVDYYVEGDLLKWDGMTLDGLLAENDEIRVVFSVENALNYFKMMPERDDFRVVSVINSERLLELTAIAGNGYFNDISKISRVDIVYQDSNYRERKRIIHVGSNLEGQAFWSTFARSGTWYKIEARLRDKDGATLLIDRDIIGDREDLVLS